MQPIIEGCRRMLRREAAFVFAQILTSRLLSENNAKETVTERFQQKK
jgi:hypothetical protein